MKLIHSNKRSRIFLLFAIGLQMTILSQSQEVLSLNECYLSAETNYPLQAKKGLLNSQHELEQELLSIQRLPKFELGAQATYQSDVVSLPFSLPNMEIESPNQEQWKATFTASQLIYNGGLIDLQKNINKAESDAKQQEINVQFHQVKSQINQLYFSVLSVEQTKEILEKNIKQLQHKISETESRIKNGVAPENATESLQVKVLELQQKVTEINATRQQLVDKLGLVIGKNISSNTQLSIPNVFIAENQNTRPELALFDLQKEVITQNANLLSKKNFPKISAFGTAGVGNPGLNMLDNSMQEFYILGAKLQWSVFDWNANIKQRQTLAINKDIIDNQRTVFEWQQNITANAYVSEIEKYQMLLKSDAELIALHKRIVATASKQLKHDIITTADYTAEVNKLLAVEINQKEHAIQIALAKANYQVIMFK